MPYFSSNLHESFILTFVSIKFQVKFKTGSWRSKIGRQVKCQKNLVNAVEVIFSSTLRRKGSLYYSPRRRRWCHTFVKVFVPIHFFVKTITNIALKLTTLIHYHYFYQQTRVHNSVKIFVRIMTLFRLRILVNFFVPIYLFSKPLQILL